MTKIKKVKNLFIEKFNTEPILINSPGRVNLIGEHTDYNNGFVLPAAVDKSIVFAVTPNNSEKIKIYAADLDDYFEVELNYIKYSDKIWPNYLLGVVEQFNKRYYDIKGFNCVFGGDVPSGAGMSSSAAIEGGLAFTLNYMFDLNISKIDLVKMAQKAENEFVGVNCGIMDQYINIFGEEQKVLKIDCETLEYEQIPFVNENLKIVLCNSMVTHSLAGSEYNTRREQCEEGVQILQNINPDISSLRNVQLDFLEKQKNIFDPVVFKRCKYVIEENLRLQKTCKFLSEGDFVSVGKMLNASHKGLSEEYEVSCPELDFLASESQKTEGVLGSRMMGGGFGGCTINLVEEKFVKSFTENITKKYSEKYNRTPEIYISSISKGTHIINS